MGYTAAVRCANCQREVPAGAVACEACGRRLRATPPSGSGVSGVYTSAASTMGRARARPSAVLPAEGQAQVATRLIEVGAEGHKETRVMNLPVPGVVKRAARRRAAELRGEVEGADALPPVPIDVIAAEMRRGYTRLHRLDRWAVWLAGSSFVGAFLPWKRVPVEGLVSGVETHGAISAAAAVLGLAAIVWRAQLRRAAGRLMLLQLGALSVTVAVPVALVLALGRQVSWHVGVPIVAGAGALALLVSLARLFRLHA